MVAVVPLYLNRLRFWRGYRFSFTTADLGANFRMGTSLALVQWRGKNIPTSSHGIVHITSISL